MSFGTCSFPIKQWAAHTTSGTIYTEFSGPRRWRTSRTRRSRRRSPSNTSTPGTYNSFAAYFGRWLADKWTPDGAYWDGVYLDVWGNRIWNNTNPWDPFYGGPNEAKQNYATDTIYADPPLRPQVPSPTRPLAAGHRIWQRHDPQVRADLAVLVANNTQSPTTAPGENGRLWESFADPALGRQWSWTSQLRRRERPAADPYSFATCTGIGPPGRRPRTSPTSRRPTTARVAARRGFPDRRQPVLRTRQPHGDRLPASPLRPCRDPPGERLLGPGDGELCRACRTSTRWTEARCTPTATSAPRRSEPDVREGERGLGHVSGRGSYADGVVFRRDFQNGIALVDSSSSSESVYLGSAKFHRLTCTQNSEGTHGDLSVDNGATVTGTVTILGTDGLILLNGPGGKALKKCGS